MKRSLRTDIRKFLLMTTVTIFTVCLAACEEKLDIDDPDNPDTPVIDAERSTVESPTAIVGSLPDGWLGEAMAERFPVVADIKSSSVAIFSGTSLSSTPDSDLLDVYESGKLIIVANPDTQTDDILIEKLGARYTPYCENDGLLIYAFDSSDHHYLLYGEDNTPKEEVEMEEVDLSGLEGKTDKDETGDESDVVDGEIEKEHVHELEYYHLRLDTFVDWVNDLVKEKNRTAYNSTRESAGGYTPKYIMNNNAISIEVDLSFELDNKIDKGTNMKTDYLKGHSKVTFSYKIYPLYVHNIEGETEEQAGDYYIVDGTMTVHNAPLWNPDRRKHGGCNNRIIGYYMTKADALIELVDKDDVHEFEKSAEWKQVAWEKSAPPFSSHHLSGVKFFLNPLPKTTVGSVTYTEGVQYGMNITAGGKATTKDGIGAEVSGGFSASWSKDKSQTLADVSYANNSEGARVIYQYTINNIQNKRNWGDWNKNYPPVCRSNFEPEQTWIWKVPHGQNGVEKDSKTAFYLKMSFRGYYGVFSWWRGASWDKTQEFNTILKTTAIKITPPNRKPFGALAIKNAARQTIGRITVTDPATGENRRIAGSYAYNEEARVILPTGTYRVDYDVVDPKTNKVVSKWYMENVEVFMRANETASTNLISTIDFSELKTEENKNDKDKEKK